MSDNKQVKDLVDQVYDLLFNNSFNVDIDFSEEFPDSYVDGDKNQIVFENETQRLVLTLSRSE